MSGLCLNIVVGQVEEVAYQQEDTIPNRTAVAPPEPYLNGEYTKDTVEAYLNFIKLRMASLKEIILSERAKPLPSWHAQAESREGRRNPIVDFVKVEDFGVGAGAIVWGVGMAEAGKLDVERPVFPVAPVKWGIRIKDEEKREWQTALLAGQASERLRERLYEGLFGGEGNPKKILMDIHGWGGTVVGREHHTKAMFEGIEEAGGETGDYIALLVSPMGAMGTADNDQVSDGLTIEPAVTQCIGVIEGAYRVLWEEFGASNREFDRNDAWRAVGGVEGHSMGAWIAANMIRELTPRLDRAGNKQVMWFLDNPVIYGAYPSEAILGEAREILETNAFNEGHVLLLRQFVTGFMVRKSPLLMRSGIIKELAGAMVVPLLVKSYLGNAGIDNGKWVWLNHNWTAVHDSEFIRICNIMLANAGFILKDKEHLKLLRELNEAGQLVIGVGSGDKILTPEEQMKFALKITNNPRDTEDHYDTVSGSSDLGRKIVIQASKNARP